MLTGFLLTSSASALLSSGAGGLGGWAQHRKAAPSTWDLITANHFTLEVTDEGPGVPCSSPVRKDKEGRAQTHAETQQKTKPSQLINRG